MATRNVNANVAAGKLGAPVKVVGADTITLVLTFETAATDAAADVLVLAKGLSPRLVPVKIEINNDAIAGASDIDLGLYDSDTGVVADADCFADGMNLSGAHAMGSELSGLSALGIDDIGDTLQEIIGDTNKSRPSGYDLCLTLNSEVTAAGTVSVRATFAQGL